MPKLTELMTLKDRVAIAQAITIARLQSIPVSPSDKAGAIIGSVFVGALRAIDDADSKEVND
jgi:hypothetical protein